MTMRLPTVRLLAALALALAWGAASAQYPARPVKVVVPATAGDGSDVLARALTRVLAESMSTSFVIENRPGAGGNVGTRMVANAPADGYTWLYAGSPIASNMRMFRNPGFDALKDFRYLLRLTKSEVLLIVDADSGIASLDELVAKLKAQPGKIDYASGGIGTPSHLGMEQLLAATGTQALHVPYKGASELVNAVMGKQVTFGMPILSVAYPFVRSGKLRALATSGRERNPVLPKVASFTELGVKGLELTSWGGIAVPAGTPDAATERIRAAFVQAMKNPDLIARLEQQGGQVDVQGTQDFVRSIEQEMQITGLMMKRVGLEPN